MADYDNLPINPYQDLPSNPAYGVTPPLMGQPFIPQDGMTPNAPQMGMSQPPNYAQQLQQMLAPYQQMAAKMQSPYATMQPNSFLAQHLGRFAGPVDNALLTVGMMGPGGMTAGSNIQAVAQGLTGATQFRRQQAMQTAMLPYQMLEPQLKAEDQLAQIQERQSEVPYRQAMEQRAMAQSDWYARRMNEPNTEQQKMQLAASMAGIPGFTGDFSKLNPTQAQQMGKALDDITMRQAQAAMGGGLTPGHIVQMQMSSDPNVAAQGIKAAQLYTTLTGGQAAARTSAEQTVKLPQADIDSEVKMAQGEYKDQKPMSAADFEHQMTVSPNATAYWKDPAQAYQNYVSSVNQKNMSSKQAYDATVSDYRAKARQNPGLKWHDYLRQSASQGPTSGGTLSPAAPSNRPPGW